MEIFYPKSKLICSFEKSLMVQVIIIDNNVIYRWNYEMELRIRILHSFVYTYLFRCMNNVKLGVYKANITIGSRIQMFRNGRGDVLNEKILTTLHSHLTLFHPCIDTIVNTINWIFSFDPHSILYNQCYTNVFSRGFIFQQCFFCHFHPFIISNFFFLVVTQMKILFVRIWSTLWFNDTIGYQNLQKKKKKILTRE